MAEIEKRISFTPPAKLAGTPILRCAAHDGTVISFGRNDGSYRVSVIKIRLE
jgi:hypothetical protein